ncbi:hypothetical protein GCM10022254_17930 [Actinomadura meridiana]|uniref:Uncharacterized protein n=1 Tax=Actinomadura meridiana TaxID=559626 RepID=A0ABP8BW53_9ACTN
MPTESVGRFPGVCLGGDPQTPDVGGSAPHAPLWLGSAVVRLARFSWGSGLLVGLAADIEVRRLVGFLSTSPLGPIPARAAGVFAERARRAPVAGLRRAGHLDVLVNVVELFGGCTALLWVASTVGVVSGMCARQGAG